MVAGAGLTGPHLRVITTLPDLPHPALSRVLTSYTGRVEVLAVVPDGWFVVFVATAISRYVTKRLPRSEGKVIGAAVHDAHGERRRQALMLHVLSSLSVWCPLLGRHPGPGWTGPVEAGEASRMKDAHQT